jgi:CII-binding regulator of phage lambda lysogenization HflD
MTHVRGTVLPIHATSHLAIFGHPIGSILVGIDLLKFEQLEAHNFSNATTRDLTSMCLA